SSPCPASPTCRPTIRRISRRRRSRTTSSGWPRTATASWRSGPSATTGSRRPRSDRRRVSYLEVRHLEKRFGDVTALGDISLDVAEGEFVCFLGPSGCGKTTLLRAIAGLDPQTSGTIHQKGRDVSRLPPAERDFGIVFQSYALFPNLTVAENVGYGLVSRRLTRAGIAKRVD